MTLGVAGPLSSAGCDRRIPPMTPFPDFPSTHWTRLRRDQGTDGGTRWFCEEYRPAILAYLARRVPLQDAEDLCQEFFRQDVMEGALVERAASERGSLRSLLRTALSRFLVDHWRRTGAQKRGGHVEHCRLDGGDFPESDIPREMNGLEPDRAFDRAWAHHLLNRAVKNAEDAWTSKGKAALFDALRPQLATADPSRTHAEIARTMGMSAHEVTRALHSLRQAVSRSLLDEVVATVAGKGSFEDEWEAVRTALRDE